MAPYISPFHHVLDSVANPLYDTMALEPDEMWMHLALQEARRGVGHTTPNPPVGCVLVRDGTLLSKGYHHFAGAPHAEAAAITQAGVSLNRSTAYVTLEPCNHQGRTSPCTDRLIGAGVSRVVIGAIDPNPRVNGAGIQKLRASGIQVDIIDGPFGDYAKALIAPFASSITKGLPWVTLKSAVSLDGGIAAEEGVCTPITGLQTKQVVHRLRSCVDAVLIGERTAKIDDPRLTVRNTGAWSYEKAEPQKIS